MSESLTTSFEIASWDESPFDEGDGLGKLTRASVGRTYSGDIDGESVTEWAMAYRLDETATFVGIERIRGRIAGRDGSLVLQHVGEFRDGAARAALTVVADSGSGELTGVSGEGQFVADPKGSMTLQLHFR
jgi:Protein of unknown function (DUF3224)